MYCKNCGNEIKENTKFCGKCGKKIEQIINEDEDKKKNVKEKEEIEEEKMFCRNCGESIPKSSNACPKCGYLLNRSNNINTTSGDDSFETIVIYITSFIMPIVGIILWAMTKEQNPKRAKTSLYISLISIGIVVLIMLLIFIFLMTYLISSNGGM